VFEWLAEIIAGTKKIEHREIKPYLDETVREGLRPIRATAFPGSRSDSANPPDHKAKRILVEKFLPTNLPTENGSYSPFQRLAAPVENVSR
jgi:hypothetical protein